MSLPRLRGSRGQRESGFVSVEMMVAVALSFLLLVILTNIVLVQYGRGLVRASVDEGARAGARLSADPIGSCTERANSVLEGVGTMASDVTITCEIVNGQVRATASADFPGWIPGVPTFSENAVAISGKENEELEVDPVDVDIDEEAGVEQ